MFYHLLAFPCLQPLRRTLVLVIISLLCIYFSTDLEQECVEQHDNTTRGQANTWFQYAAALLTAIKTTAHTRHEHTPHTHTGGKNMCYVILEWCCVLRRLDLNHMPDVHTVHVAYCEITAL